MYLFFCGANSIFHWIYTHSDFWWSCKLEKESLMCDSWKGVYTFYWVRLLEENLLKKTKISETSIFAIMSQYLVMSHFNLYLWLKQLKVRGHICKPPMPQIVVIRHGQ